jgi:NADH-quinone oxidoreductase subunit E
MQDRPAAKIPTEIASAVNLVAHPAAGVAALSALSLGMASQMFGVWMGAMAGAVEASRKALEALETDAKAAPSEPVRSATVTILADARKAAARSTRKATPKPLAVSASATKAEPAKPLTLGEPTQADDLKLIPGIGPKLEKVLNGLGIWTYAQIASWTPDEVAAMDGRLSFGGRIQRDGWVAQASRLRTRG